MFWRKPSEKNNAIIVVLTMALLWCMTMLVFMGSVRIRFEDNIIRRLDVTKERCAELLEEELFASSELTGHPLSGTDVAGNHWLVLNEDYQPMAEGEALSWWMERGFLNEDGSLQTALQKRLAATGPGGLAAASILTGARENCVASAALSGGFCLLYAGEPAEMEAGYSFLMSNYLLLGLCMLGVCALGLVLLFVWRGRDRRNVKEEKDRLAWLEERYRIIARESEDVIFEISLKDKWIEANENLRKLFGYNVVKWNKELKKQIHPDDLETFEAIYRDLKSGKRTMKDDMRLKRADGSYIWCRVLIAVLSDSGGKPERVLGKITNIDTQKREAAWLLQRAQQDSLTNLYNNETTKYMVNRYLASEGADGTHGLILIDVDDFKAINDTRGHLFGDAVLMKAAGRLKALFRSTDIMGRIGGDEFMVFLKNVSDRSQLEAQARSILEAFRISGDAENGITCSIGAALYSEDGNTVDELFKHADIALYRSKKVGKNRYSVYDPAIDVGNGEHGDRV